MPHAVYSAPANVGIGVDVAASIRANVAANLRRLLFKNELTQRDFAEGLGIDESVVSTWTRGKHLPDYANFDKIHAKYGWTYDQLVRDPDKVTAEDALEIIRKFADSAGFNLVKKD